MSLFGDTLRGICTRRRAIPIAVVCLPMMILDGRFAGSRGVALATVIFTGFLCIGPVSYRALFPDSLKADFGIARVAAFAGVDLLYVAVFGVVTPRILHVPYSLFLDPLTLYAAVPLFWAGSWALGRDLESEASLKEARTRNEALVREAERAQLLALRTHLDPHFLFNTLNAIAEWCRDDPKVAERATLQLSNMLRTILDGVKSPSWPLSDEITLTRQLLELHQARDPQRFVFELNVTDEAATVPVPPMVVLSLVENAIKHGPAAGHSGKIEVTAQTSAEGLNITIRNPGPYRGRRPGGEGLATVEKRLQLAYDGKAAMSHSSDDATTTARLDLPLQLHGDAV